MSQHSYHVSLENLTNMEGVATPHARLQFESNHDEIISLAGRLREHVDFDSEQAKSLSVSLKLLKEVLEATPHNLLTDDLRLQLDTVLSTLQKSDSFETTAEPQELAIPLQSAYSILGRMKGSELYLGGMKRHRQINA